MAQRRFPKAPRTAGLPVPVISHGSTPVLSMHLQEPWPRGHTELPVWGQRTEFILHISLKASPSCKWVQPQADKSKPAGLVAATSLPGVSEGGQLPTPAPGALGGLHRPCSKSRLGADCPRP